MAPSPIVTRSKSKKSSQHHDDEMSSCTTGQQQKEEEQQQYSKNNDDDNTDLINIDDNTLREIFTTTKTIALIGASNKIERPSNEVMNVLLNHCKYNVIPVNPNLADGGKTKIYGQKVYKSLKDVIIQNPNIQIDMVDIFRNSKAAGEVIDEVIDIVSNSSDDSCNSSSNSSSSSSIKYIWMQIGVINKVAAIRAQKESAGKLKVIMTNTCPVEEIPRLFGHNNNPCPNVSKTTTRNKKKKKQKL